MATLLATRLLGAAAWLRVITAALVCAAMGAACCTPARAALSVQGTRAIFLEQEGESLVRLSNLGAEPVLAQAWIDDGNAAADPGTLRLPLTLTPPVARIEQGGGQVLRIVQTGGDLPDDRESLLWLNVLEVPPRPVGDAAGPGANTLQLAFRTRIKLFFRPRGLAEPPERAHERLQMELVEVASTPSLRVANGSAYHLTFRELVVREAVDAPVLARMHPAAERMVAPGQSLVMPLQIESARSLHGGRVFFTLIGDQGGDRHGQRTLVADPAAVR